MDMVIKKKFLTLWKKYFNDSELPLTFYYADKPTGKELIQSSIGHRCIITDLSKARGGNSISFNADSISCFGGKKYLGYATEIRPDFEYFLSCGIPGKLKGERYRKTPELVNELMKKVPKFEAPEKFIVFKRWDKLEEKDEPEVVIFFAQSDVLSGLFTLANFDIGDPNAVYCPFSSGCGSIVQYPYLEKDSNFPKAVLGMFDVSARPHVPENVLTFAIPMKKFTTMIENMEESFLITESWAKVQKRIK
jgi:uncharacterized protein (DUF169 family)